MSDYRQDRLGQQVGNYRIVGWLGRGSYADVYKGKHILLKRTVAIKILCSDEEELDLQAFIDEALLASELNHPHIVKVQDCGIEGQLAFLIMDYAPGGTLRERYATGTRLEPDMLLELFAPIADAVQYIHDKGYIHGDIKPENILLGSNNEPLLGDFGISIAVQQTHAEGGIRGTIAYMAPELLSSDGHYDFASDQYALAIMMYELLCGTRPFQGTAEQVIAQHLRHLPPSLCERVPTIPQAVENVLIKALAKYPEQRFENVQAFFEALTSAFESQPTTLKIETTRIRHASMKTEVIAPVAAPIHVTRNKNSSSLGVRKKMNNRQQMYSRQNTWREVSAWFTYDLLTSVALLSGLNALHIPVFFLELILILYLVAVPCVGAYLRKNSALFFLNASITLVALIPALLFLALEPFIIIYFGLMLLSLLLAFLVSLYSTS